jgi:hypothetical protein
VVLLPGEQLLLETASGWSADVVVQRVVVDGSVGKMLVRFTGTAPLGPADSQSA